MMTKLKENEIELVSINAGAIVRQNAVYREHTIKRGMYGVDIKGEPIPAQDIETAASIEYLAVRQDAPTPLVNALLHTIHGDPIGLPVRLSGRVKTI